MCETDFGPQKNNQTLEWPDKMTLHGLMVIVTKNRRSHFTMSIRGDGTETFSKGGADFGGIRRESDAGGSLRRVERRCLSCGNILKGKKHKPELAHAFA
jgi:hypothetical protein